MELDENERCAQYLPWLAGHAEMWARRVPGDQYDDIFSDGMLGILLGVRSFDPERTVDGELAWVRTNVKQEIVDGFRRRMGRASANGGRTRPAVYSMEEVLGFFDEDEEHLHDVPTGDMSEHEMAEFRADLGGMFSVLTARQIEAVNAIFWEQLTLKELGDRMNLTPSGVSRLVRTALIRMAEQYGIEGAEPRLPYPRNIRRKNP